MPRRARIYLPGFPYHIVQHSNNREACFVATKDYRSIWICGSQAQIV